MPGRPIHSTRWETPNAGPSCACSVSVNGTSASWPLRCRSVARQCPVICVSFAMPGSSGRRREGRNASMPCRNAASRRSANTWSRCGAMPRPSLPAVRPRTRRTAAMIEPLRLVRRCASRAAHAFRCWTDQIGRWWPADHTTTAIGDLTGAIEPRVGGRIFERTPAGSELDWGGSRLGAPGAIRLPLASPSRPGRTRPRSRSVRPTSGATGRAWRSAHRAGSGSGRRVRLARRNRGGWETRCCPFYISRTSNLKEDDHGDRQRGPKRTRGS